MTELSKRDKILLGILIVLAIGFLYYKFLLTPSLNELSIAQTQLSGNQSRVNLIQSKEVMNVGLKKQLESLSNKNAEATKEITVNMKDADIVTNLSNLCVKDSLKLSSVTFGQGTKYSNNATTNSVQASNNSNIKDDTLMTLNANIEVEGDKNNIITFIKDLEQGKRIANIRNISINSSNNAFIATINTDFYYFYVNETTSISN